MSKVNVPVQLPNDVVPLTLNNGVVIATAVVKGKSTPQGKRCDHGKDRGVGWELFFNSHTNQYTMVWDCPSQCFKIFTLKRLLKVFSRWVGVNFELGAVAQHI